MRRFIQLILCAIIIFTLLYSVVIGVEAEETPDELTVLEYEILEDGSAKITKYDSLSTEYTIPSTIDGYTVTQIGKKAFYSCHNLKKVTFPDTITDIGDQAFDKCQKLTTVVLSDSVKTIGYKAFSDCRALSSINFPNSITTIGNNAFIRCQKLKTIRIPDSVTSIGNFAFSDCIMISTITIENGDVSIGEYAFAWCLSLENLYIGTNTVDIKETSFYACDAIKTIKIYNPDCLIFDSENTFPQEALIWGYLDSTAQRYAEKYNRTFVDIENPPIEVMIGDANLDGIVSVLDATLIQFHLAKLDTLSDKGLIYSDTNRDGVITILDATKIQMFLSNIITQL